MGTRLPIKPALPSLQSSTLACTPSPACDAHPDTDTEADADSASDADTDAQRHRSAQKRTEAHRRAQKRAHITYRHKLPQATHFMDLMLQLRPLLGVSKVPPSQGGKGMRFSVPQSQIVWAPQEPTPRRTLAQTREQRRDNRPRRNPNIHRQSTSMTDTASATANIASNATANMLSIMLCMKQPLGLLRAK